MKLEQLHPVPESLASIKSKADAEKAVKHAMLHMELSRPAAIGHLVGLITGKGQFNAAVDGGLANVFPWLFQAHLDAAGAITPEESEELTEEAKEESKPKRRTRKKKA